MATLPALDSSIDLRAVRVRPTWRAREHRRWDRLVEEHHYLAFHGVIGKGLRGSRPGQGLPAPALSSQRPTWTPRGYLPVRGSGKAIAAWRLPPRRVIWGMIRMATL